ncbi:MAG: ArsC family transcriptional regulator [Oscillospiraceae bacterium]|jgi:arsenate reductase|nr:ArsC family transcriptional regulator [Oscillospiraceae bacterium]
MIQLMYLKRGFDVQKAERYFKERRVPVQMVDLARAPLGARVLEGVMREVGFDALFDKASAAFRECPSRYSGNTHALLDAAARDPRMLCMPITRNGQRAAVGYAPEVWERWIE